MDAMGMQREGKILREKDTIYSQDLYMIRVNTYRKLLESTVHNESAWIRRVGQTKREEYPGFSLQQIWPILTAKLRNQPLRIGTIV